MKQIKNLGRRSFLKQSAGAAVVASAVGGVTGQASSQATTPGRSKAPDFIIDSHIHCGGTDAWVNDVLRNHGARQAMACVLTRIKDMELVRKAMKDHPEVFIGYGYVDLDDANAVREVETFHQNGFVGMKFHSPQKDYDDPSYFQVYRLCEHFRMHMLFHTGVTSRTISDTPRLQSATKMRPMFLDTLSRVCPKTTLQGAHLGNPWYEEAAEAARWNPNLYFDVTGSTLLKFIKLGRLERMSEILWWASGEAAENPHTLKGGPGAWEHIVFGTDEAPAGFGPNIERFQKMLDANNVSDSDRAKMWGLTIAGILGIDPKTRKYIPKTS